MPRFRHKQAIVSFLCKISRTRARVCECVVSSAVHFKVFEIVSFSRKNELLFLFYVKVCFFWKIVKIMVTVLNTSYYMISMVFDVAVVVAAVLLLRTNQNYFI